MVTRILIIVFIFSGILVFSGVNAISAYEFAADSGLKSTANPAGFETDGAETIDSKIGFVVQAILSFLGVIFLILMIYGGYLWMAARGNDEQVAKAKKLITAAVIGLVIVISAYAISYLVVSKLGGEALKSA